MYDLPLLKNIPKHQRHQIHQRHPLQTFDDHKQTKTKNLTKRGVPHHIGQFPVPLPASLYDGSQPNNVNSSNIAGSILNDMGHNNYKKEDVKLQGSGKIGDKTNEQQPQKSQPTDIAANKTQKVDDLLTQTFLWVVQFSVISIFIKNININSSVAYFGMLVIIGILTMDHGPAFKFGVLMILLFLNMVALKNT